LLKLNLDMVYQYGPTGEGGVMVHASDYLAQMAALVRKNPSITVREIADKLQFADSKSVYYWLEKGNVKGIKDFKRMVLGDEQQYQEGWAVQQNHQTLYVVQVPLLDWDPKQKKPLGEWFFFHHHPSPRGIFAVQINTQEFSPWFLDQDVLVIDETQPLQENHWVLLQSGQEFLLGRVVRNLIIDPRVFKNYPPSCQPLGTVLLQHRGCI
jgi:hypothetical protein